MALEAAIAEEESLVNENRARIRAEEAKQNDHGERQRKQEESERLAAEVDDWQRRIYDTNAAIQRLEAEIRSKEATDKENRKRKDQVRAQLDQAKSHVDGLIRTKQNSLTSFHVNMPKAFMEVQRRVRQFRDPPIGPLGMHVKLKDTKDEEWVRILERLFGRNLNAFLVTNHDDRKQLSAILEANKWYHVLRINATNDSDVPIIVSKRDQFDYRSGEPDPKFKTVLKSLDVHFLFGNNLTSRSMIRM